MNRIWHVFWREFWGHVTRKSYLLFTLGFPAFLTIVPAVGGLILALAVASAVPETDLRPIGIVDDANVLLGLQDLPDSEVEVQRFSTIAEANDALQAKILQAYYHISTDYWQTGEVKIIYANPPTMAVDAVINGWIRRRVRAQIAPDILSQLDRAPNIIQQTITGEQVFSVTDLLIAGIIFFVSYFIQLGASFTANYMFDSIASEANDRTIEIVITSISPMQFLVGKVVGLLLVGLCQLAVWGGLALIIAVWASRMAQFNLLAIVLGWEHLGVTISLLLGAYVITQLFAAVVGMLQINSGSGPLLFNTLNWVVGFGWIYAIAIVPRTPDAIFAVLTSLFPLTSPIVMLVRIIVSEVPVWQVVLAQLLLWGTAFASLFLLRQLLKTNLVSYAPRFKLWPWLKSQIRHVKLST